ncbi:hypothetical protein [Sinorhizobium meliloti]|uniref:hypothetical protein n=1 Tax=Rhizobium meliloti TaxID=382 RepID=UPI003F5CD62B
MSRYTVQITNGTTTDDEGTIGYDRPLRTFFLQAFPDPETDECALWLGAFLEEYSTLESIIEAARTRGYEVRGLADISFEGGSSSAGPAAHSGRMGHPDRGDGLALEPEVLHVVPTT